MVTDAERAAWNAIYKLYDGYAERLRAADPDAAAAIFSEVVTNVTSRWENSSDPARLILLTGVGLLDDVWKSAHK